MKIFEVICEDFSEPEIVDEVQYIESTDIKTVIEVMYDEIQGFDKRIKSIREVIGSLRKLD